MPALAEPTYFECKRLDAPQTAYLKLDEATQSALILDKPDLLRKTEARPAEDFTFLAVDFEQFYKYRFNRKTSLLTEKKMGVNADYQCQGINPQ